MKIHVLGSKNVTKHVLETIAEGLRNVFPETKFKIETKALKVPSQAFNQDRQQYHSTIILGEIRKYAEKQRLTIALGVVDVDLYVPQLNFVFGEAECPGKAAVISTFRLNPEIYDRPPNETLLTERCIKEAVHEIGHALGLMHCRNPFCVMHFSNSIYDTDVKQRFFCTKCYSTLVKILEEKEALS
jgi:archaemetzincin